MSQQVEQKKENAQPAEKTGLEEALGLWGDNKVDGLEYEKALREEWEK